ncbi:MAG TPA: hypothetical protein VK829_04240 [Terriglobales bacterium]|jgi:hypothetical protein|nr:hypothetical protein [Terriglobales bacterium]
MTNPLKLTLLSAALAGFLLPAAAQTANPPATSNAPAAADTPASTSSPATSSSPASPGPVTRGIQQRKEIQQGRIANGIADGQLTAGEASSLEKKESQLNQEERAMKAEDNGHLTQADRAKLQQQQNQLSNQIYKDKHNSDVANTHLTSEEGKRADNQQQRIAQGVNGGQLTAGEAANLEKNENAIHKEVEADRAANANGKLTAQEKAQVNAQQNRLSKKIYKDKHNNKRQ